MASLKDLIGSMMPVASPSGLGGGKVAAFNYSLYRHDPYPVILVLEDEGPYLTGLNLHYLSFPQIQGLLRRFGPFITYSDVQNLPNIRDAFRRYKKTGMRQVRISDLNEIVQRMRVPRVHTEDEVVEARRRLEQQAEEMVETDQPEPTEGTEET